MKLSVIIPMYNEKATAADCAKLLTEKLESNAAAESYEYEIIFSDDGSSDGCGDIVREWSLGNPLKFGRVEVIASPQNEGKGSAVRRGMLKSSGEYALFTDCDLAYGADVIIEFMRYAEKNRCDILIGSRAIHPEGYEGYTFLRKSASRAFIKLLSFAAGFKHSDSQSGIKLYAKGAAHEVFSRCTVNGWAFDFESLLIAEKLKFGISEYPVKIINHRESKIRLISDSFRMMSDVRKIKHRVKRL